MELIIDILFKIKDGYKIELKTPETTKLFGSTKNQQAKSRMEKMYRVLNQQKQV